MPSMPQARSNVGERTGAVVVFRDITERKAAGISSKSRWDRLWKRQPRGFYVSDAGRISMANAACARITGWTSEQCLDRTVQEVLFPERAGLRK